MSSEPAGQFNQGQPEELMMNLQILPEAWVGWNTYNTVPELPPDQYADYQYLKEPVSYVDKSEYIQGPSAATTQWSDQWLQQIDPMGVSTAPWQQQEACTTKNQPTTELEKELNSIREDLMKLKKQ